MKIRDLKLKPKAELENYNIDSTNYIDCLYYDLICLQKQIIKFNKADEAIANLRYYRRKIEDYYKYRENWCSANEAAQQLNLSSRTILRYYYKGYIRAERFSKREKSRLMFCKRDVEDFKNEI
ncbi:hypothetical protein ACFL2K_00960 [Candidatus Margulisiibacteriota bacterium]